jgi:ATP-dependent Clp protease adaptor protein ClpS
LVDPTINKSAIVLNKKELFAKIKIPSYYNVILLNDDFTTMEFVIQVLLIFFKMKNYKARNIMLKIHKEGAAICGIFTKDVAETLASNVNNYSRQNLFPLKCIVKIK